MKLTKSTWGFLIVSGIIVGGAVGYNSPYEVIAVAVTLFLTFLFMAHEDYTDNEEKKKQKHD